MSSKNKTPENNLQPALTKSEIYTVLQRADKKFTVDQVSRITSFIMSECNMKLSLKEDSEPEENLINAQEYLKYLDLPEGFKFELHHNGKKTFVLEDVSEEKDWIKTIDGYLEKDKKTLSDRVDALNGDDDLPKEVKRQTFVKKESEQNDIFKLQNELADRIYDQIQKTCCDQHCTIKETPGGNTKREYLKSLNNVKTPEAFFNNLERDLKHQGLTVKDFREYLVMVNNAYMDTPMADDRSHRAEYIVRLFDAVHTHFNNLEDMTL